MEKDGNTVLVEGDRKELKEGCWKISLPKKNV